MERGGEEMEKGEVGMEGEKAEMELRIQVMKKRRREKKRR